MNFKVGDWVRVFGTPTRILRVGGTKDEPEYYNTGYGYRDGCLNPVGLEPWQPKGGEWCWFTIEMDEGDFEHPTLMRYGEQPNIPWIIEPFIGTLPSFIKDKQCTL